MDTILLVSLNANQDTNPGGTPAVQGATAVHVGNPTGINNNDLVALVLPADGADATNATDRGIVAVRGSTINAHASDTTGFGGSTGYRILNGSFINATNGTGSTSETVNTLTANGAIFQ